MATTAATTVASETIGRVYTLGAKASKFSEISETANLQAILGILYQNSVRRCRLRATTKLCSARCLASFSHPTLSSSFRERRGPSATVRTAA